MRKFCLFLFSITIFFYSSCKSDIEEIIIHWNVFCDISNIDFDETPIELEFIWPNDKNVFKLKPNETKTIKLKKDGYLLSMSFFGGCMVFMYPAEIPGLGFDINGEIEIYLYTPWVTEINEDSITMLPHKDVLAYKYVMYRRDTEHTIISKNNCINTNIGEIYEIEAGPVNDVLNIMEIKKLDVCFYSISTYPLYSDRFDDYVGYYVESNLSDNGIIMLSTQK